MTPFFKVSNFLKSVLYFTFQNLATLPHSKPHLQLCYKINVLTLLWPYILTQKMQLSPFLLAFSCSFSQCLQNSKIPSRFGVMAPKIVISIHPYGSIFLLNGNSRLHSNKLSSFIFKDIGLKFYMKVLKGISQAVTQPFLWI